MGAQVAVDQRAQPVHSGQAQQTIPIQVGPGQRTQPFDLIGAHLRARAEKDRL